jgi:hypothetical protein
MSGIVLRNNHHDSLGRRSQQQQQHHRSNREETIGFDSQRAKLFLALACLWPLCLMALFSASAPHVAVVSNQNNNNNASPHRALTSSMRDILDRVDMLGYGPTHPRTAIVIVGKDPSQLRISVESVIQNTDLNRIFVIVVLADGIAYDTAYKRELEALDAGAVPHWHGLRPHGVHDTEQRRNAAAEENGQEDEGHARKIHVLFNDQARGVTEARADAIDFIRILEKHHLENGLKDPQEDLILLLMQEGTQLTVCIRSNMALLEQ